MKWNRYISLSTVVLCVMAGSVQAASAIEKPAVMPEAMLSVTVSDLHGFIDEVGTVVGQSSPMMSGAMLKNMIGMQIGDPGLAGIAPGKGLAFVALDVTNMFAIIEVAEAQSAVYANLATQQGMQSRYSGGLLVLGKTAALVDKGVSMADQVQTKLLAVRAPSLRVAAQPAAIIERNNEAIQGLLEMMPGMLGAGMPQTAGADTNAVDGVAAILEAELRVLLSIASQCEVCEVVLAPQGGAVRISETFAPKAGTRLAALINSPKTGKADPKIQSGLLGSSEMIMMDFVVGNAQAFADFISGETKSLVDEMDLKEIDPVKLIEGMKKWTGIYAGAGAETVDFDADDGLSVGYLVAISDEANALNLFKTMEQDMAPFFKLYENMGMPIEMAFKENVREHKGIKIHTFDMQIEIDDMLPEQKKQMADMKLDNMVYELAIFDGKVLYAMGKPRIETLIDRVKDEAAVVKPIKARSVYPADGFYYLDFDVGRYAEIISAFMPEEAVSPIQPQIIAMLQGVDPVTSAGFRQDGLVMWSINIPGDLIGKLSQIGMMIQMQNMQQQMGSPQGMPSGIPQTMPVQ